MCMQIVVSRGGSVEVLPLLEETTSGDLGSQGRRDTVVTRAHSRMEDIGWRLS